MARDARSLAVLVAAAALLAGCGGFGGTGGAPGTATPAPVPTVTATYPPGVSGDGVFPEALASAHEERLSTTEYRVASRQRVVGPNGTMRTTNRTVAVADGGRVYAGRFNRTLVDFPVGALPLTLEYWTNGSVYATREFVAGSPEYYGWSRSGFPTEDVDYSNVFRRTFAAVETRVARGSAGGVVLVGSQLRRPGAFPNPPYLADPHNVSLTARVSDAGLVTRWRLAYDATVEGRTVRVVWRIAVTDVGATTVDRPAWVDTAREWVQRRRGR